MSKSETPDPYFIDAAAKALDVLELFQHQEQVRLVDVVRELGLIKSTAFRLLYTLEAKGYIERASDGKTYRKRRRFKVGFASISKEIPFVAEVENSIVHESKSIGIDLTVRHHEFDARRLVASVEEMIQGGIDLLLCYNPDEHASYIVADRCAGAGVPVVAVTFPVPGARLFGVNNYRAGLCGGEGLAGEVARRWKSVLDLCVVLDLPGNSPAQQSRITGMLEGLRKQVSLGEEQILHVRVDRPRVSAEDPVQMILRQHRSARRIAIMSYNDVNALGALRAVESERRSRDVLILSQGGVAEVRAELRRKNSAMWGAVAHFPERFGAKLAGLMEKVLRGESVPAVTYTDHALLTRANLDTYYRDR